MAGLKFFFFKSIWSVNELFGHKTKRGALKGLVLSWEIIGEWPWERHVENNSLSLLSYLAVIACFQDGMRASFQTVTEPRYRFYSWKISRHTVITKKNTADIPTSQSTHIFTLWNLALFCWTQSCCMNGNRFIVPSAMSIAGKHDIVMPVTICCWRTGIKVETWFWCVLVLVCLEFRAPFCMRVCNTNGPNNSHLTCNCAG